MKQTAVEWLWENLDVDIRLFIHCNDTFEQAKEIEKQQIIDARVNGVAEGIDIGDKPITEDISKNHEIYYNETFKNK